MDANIGSLDKTLRLILGVILLALAVYFKNIWLGLLGVIMLGTGLTSRCPLYLPFHFSTRDQSLNSH